MKLFRFALPLVFTLTILAPLLARAQGEFHPPAPVEEDPVADTTNGTSAQKNSSNGSRVDPTENVKALAEAGAKRQDDLRRLNDRRVDAEMQCIREVAQIRDDHTEQLIALQASFQAQLALKESGRLDAIRQVDVLAATTAATNAQTAISTLATNTASSAETLRLAVANTATTMAQQLANTVAGLTERISKIEQLQYEGKGRSAYADPQIAELASKIEQLSGARSTSEGKSEGMSQTVGFIIAGIGVVLAVVGYFAGRNGTKKG